MAGQPGKSPRGSAPRTGSASCSCPHRQVWMAGEESVPARAHPGVQTRPPWGALAVMAA